MHRAPKIDTSKLELMPIPEGFKMIYFYDTKNERGFKTHKGPAKYVVQANLVNRTTNERVAFAMSKCGPNDVPNRKLGRHIAHNRCIRSYNRFVAIGDAEAKFNVEPELPRVALP